MGRVILDAELRAKLNGGRGEVEFCDEAGNVVGYYVPRDQWDATPDELPPPMTPEERAEALRDVRENGGLTTAQVRDHLRKLDEQLRGGR